MKLLAILCIALLVVPAAFATVYHDYYGQYGGDDYITWEEDYLENNKSHATPPFAPRLSFGGCYISTGKGLLEDLDCDKAPDIVDNCLGVPNPDQGDQNGNGLGDSCDLVVDYIEIDPPVVMEGRAVIVTSTLTNYRAFDLRNLQLTMQIPELGLEQKIYVDAIVAGDQESYEFFFRLPTCVSEKEYDVVLFVEWARSPGVQEFFYIPTRMGTVASGLCEEDPTIIGKTVINILDIQDVDPIDGGVYPFTIVNNEMESQAYVLTVDGLGEWGYHEIRPRSLIVVPAGESREGELIVYSREDSTGTQGFLLTLRSKSDAQQVMLTARAKESLPGPTARYLLQFGVLMVGVIILLFAFFLLTHKSAKRKKH